MTLLVCQDLHRSFGNQVAVDGVSFHVAAGETYGLLGPNGAGKTTTISMVVGLLRPNAGRVTLDGVELSPDARGAKAAIGYVPQQIALYPDLTGFENLRFFARLHKLDDPSGRIDEVLRVTGLADRARDRVDTYSGGMQRRLNIGVALLHQPRLLVLDEPTVGVDPQSRDAILEAVDRLGVDGVGVIYTTHYMEEAERLCDRVGIIDAGRLVAEGTRRELVALVGEQDRVRLTVIGDRAAVAGAVGEVEGVTAAVVTGEGVDVTLGEVGARLPALLGAATGSGATIAGVQVTEPDLEAVFLHLTGKGLRD